MTASVCWYSKEGQYDNIRLTIVKKQKPITTFEDSRCFSISKHKVTTLAKLNTYKDLYLSFLILLTSLSCFAGPVEEGSDDSISISTPQQALAYLQSLPRLTASNYWPHVDPELLYQNLNASITGPVKSFEGKNTNFCSYTALSYIPIRRDPLGFAQFVVQLYQEGKAQMGKELIRPGNRVRQAAGLMQYKGELDINHLAQMWFLSLADHFKGYLNVVNRRYDAGDENRLWAVTNFAKFNRMIRRLFRYKVNASGSDLIRPRKDDIYNYLSTRVRSGLVFLYLNNRMLYRKNHEVSRFGIPTHYVVLTNIYKEGDTITIIYWDAGRKTLQQVTPSFLNKIIYGISYCYTNP